MKKTKTVEDYIAGNGEWTEALEKLRSILLDTEMEETVKWGAPVYTIDGKNVVGIGAFKSYVGLWFFQGVFLKDKEKVLVNAQEGKTKALRQWRFSGSGEMDEFYPTPAGRRCLFSNCRTGTAFYRKWKHAPIRPALPPAHPHRRCRPGTVSGS